jgi:spermidine/putrescine-binding protein
MLGMAEIGVLRMPPKMVDPKHRNLAALGSALTVVAYNKNLIPADKIPSKWDDLLKPEFKDRKFLVDMRPPEGQDIIDKQDFVGSIFYSGSNMSKTIQGKKLCINGFADFHDSSKWMAMAVEAFGFPKESAK